MTNNDSSHKSSEICFLLISFLILFLGFISTFYLVNLILDHSANRFNVANFIANLICIASFFIYYFLLLFKRKSMRLFVSLPFTVYIFFLFLISSYYYLVPVIGMILSLILLAMSRLKKRGLILSALTVFSTYTLIMYLQLSSVLPIYVSNIDSAKSVDFAFLICIEAVLICISFGIYNLFCEKNIIKKYFDFIIEFKKNDKKEP